MPQPHLETTGQIYFKRFKCYPPQLASSLNPDTKVIWVVPCYDEPDIVATLRSLAANVSPQFPAEILIVINSSTDECSTVLERNRESKQQITQWIEQEQPSFLSCQIIHVDDLSPKHAGVGLARKIGMDEALRRFISVGYDGLIMNLDADCLVSANYLQRVEQAWLAQHPAVVTSYFEHDLSQIEQTELQQGIIHYELFLRYYISGLRYAEFPYAFHTVGSCMGCRASTYALSGGMNRRKAGEDFYFLHKVAPLGKLAKVTAATVYPSARTSNRVPFGTGKAQLDWLSHSSRHHALYHPQSFDDLKTFLTQIHHRYHHDINHAEPFPPSIQGFLQSQDFDQVWHQLLTNTRSWPVFRQRFFAWWDGFRVLKYIHYARDHFYPPLSAEEAGFRLLKKLRILRTNRSFTATELLIQYRQLDRHNN
ncbi:glycosyltransferase [Tunicatimonas pelagia]|uniref:glycosyltransferase n=1 Tax=Tunicatimonas pelagia TaxID=931531 RepID=UPI0026671C2B|nr:glycosyltransferase family A protein [Tunicatimonas pelagia]WKN44000.1 glycosyltransferase family A protein [Tunicatimonas pelagia]